MKDEQKPTPDRSSPATGNCLDQGYSSSFPIWLTTIRLLAIPVIVGLLVFATRPNQTPKHTSQDILLPSDSGKPLAAKKPAPSSEFQDIEFPPDFFFGAATSDFQTTGGTDNSDWHDYIEDLKQHRKPGKVILPGKGTDFLNRYREDVDGAHDLGLNVIRVSLEWSRIEPEEGRWDTEATKRYYQIFKYMKAKGIEPMICLNHFALPKWFAEKGGWSANTASADYEQYARFLAEHIGKPLDIKWWLTFNEPQVMLSQGYIKGTWSPFKQASITDQASLRRLTETAGHMVDAHRQAYRALHAAMAPKRIRVGFASAPGSFYPENPESTSDLTITNVFTLLNTWLFDDMVGSDRDFIGINYYGRYKLQFHIPRPWDVKAWLGNRLFDVQWEKPEERKQGNRPREFYAHGLYDLIMQFKTAGVPIIVTENGISDSEDKFREEYMTLHLKAVGEAIRAGANVQGYMYWALTDTWEWDGFFSEFGLIGIDRDHDLARVIRPSAWTYADIIANHRIPAWLLEKHKELLNLK